MKKTIPATAEEYKKALENIRPQLPKSYLAYHREMFQKRESSTEKNK